MHTHDSPAPPHDRGGIFLWAIGLNGLFVLIEIYAGSHARSVSLWADAGHNLADVLGLILSWFAIVAGRAAPNARFSYGLRSASILATLLNTLILLAGCAFLGWEAIHRLGHTTPVANQLVMIVASIGVLLNGGTALLFLRGAHDDINLRSAFLHMLMDAGTSASIVIGAGISWATGFTWIDPALSLGIIALIAWGSWGVLQRALEMMLHAVPKHVSLDAVATLLSAQPGVSSVHDVHVWHLGPREIAMTAHVVMPDGGSDVWLHNAQEALQQAFQIGHSTIQIERSAAFCAQAHAHSV